MIEDKATEKWKERAEKLGLIVNAGAATPQPKPKAAVEKATKKKGSKK